MRTDTRWKWRCRFYYNDMVEFPRVPGELAIETVHTDDFSKDIEVDAGRSRSDIGRIDVDLIKKS